MTSADDPRDDVEGAELNGNEDVADDELDEDFDADEDDADEDDDFEDEDDDFEDDEDEEEDDEDDEDEEEDDDDFGDDEDADEDDFGEDDEADEDEDDEADEAEYEPGDVNTISAPVERAAPARTSGGEASVAVLEYLARAMADEPDAVVIRREERRGSTILRLHVAPRDMGRVIGRRGRTAQAIRTLVGVAGARDGVQTVVDIADD